MLLRYHDEPFFILNVRLPIIAADNPTLINQVLFIYFLKGQLAIQVADYGITYRQERSIIYDMCLALDGQYTSSKCRVCLTFCLPRIVHL
jgi:hypothetical protein